MKERAKERIKRYGKLVGKTRNTSQNVDFLAADIWPMFTVFLLFYNRFPPWVKAACIVDMKIGLA